MLQIAVDPAAANRLYAVAAGGGCWRCDYALVQYPEFTTSSSGGILGIPGLSLDERTYAIPKWHPLSDREPVLHMTALALCNRHSSTLYVATGHYNRSWPAQLHRSDNGGASWVSPGSFNFTLVYRILVDPDAPARVYVASRAGFFGSADGGASFSLLYPGVIFDAAMDPDNASIIYIGVESVGVIKTTNARPAGGRFATVPFWHTVLPWSRANAPAGTMIRIGLGGGGSLTGRTVAVKFDQEVFVHRNSGVGDLLTWVSKGKPRAAGAQSRAGGQGDWDHVIAVDPVDDDVILVGAQNLFRTPDGGSTWTNVTGYDVSTHPDQQNVVFDPKLKGLVLLANDGGIFGSMDSGETWELDFNTGLVTAELFHAGVSGSYALSDMYHHDLVGSDTLETSVWSGTPGPYFGGSEFTDIYADLARPGRFYVFVPTRLALARWLTIPYAAMISYRP